ncbi:hypothetical protein SAMD00019534_084280 [Acytostelium subglobosum LB1]|uniref:hypothetical protein n=1 Tax=Acytostelium subglobosum LB1 TaxID=1410327 RepID=UPI00064501AA|nr:hypothetical protein SAMD00019534_084280 [Acytostelium subglobosum LB1]GAM25253.1 hypothetical protein SAMD00019534_084280 [Acytostelium subglobosum LB1]|eukprot:XP_012751773.1 hypothetical protein SAMD00019534_084280 [Acytostelium subglobosum LB1]
MDTDILLQFFDLMDDLSINIVITHYGASFQQHYMRYESLIFKQIQRLECVVLLNGIIKCFGTNYDEHKDIYQPILERIHPMKPYQFYSGRPRALGLTTKWTSS